MMSDEDGQNEVQPDNQHQNDYNNANGRDGDDESIYDQFAEIVFDDMSMQKCWLVLGKLFYDEWATDFLDPITLEAFGQDLYDDYCSVVANPIDISTIIDRMKANYYLDECGNESMIAKELFKREVALIFQNCKDFNERGSDIVQSANRMQRLFNKLWNEYGLA